MPMALLPLTHAACIAVAGIFSSRVVSVNGEVLVRPSLCGWQSFKILNVTDLEQADQADHTKESALFVIARLHYERGREYARSYY